MKNLFEGKPYEVIVDGGRCPADAGSLESAKEKAWSLGLTHFAIFKGRKFLYGEGNPEPSRNR